MKLYNIYTLFFGGGSIAFIIILSVLLVRLGIHAKTRADTVWPTRLYSLDVSRGFAAIAVIIWHWQHFFYKGYSLPQGFVRESQPLYRVLKIFYERGEIGVEYFFLLSGFIFFWLYRESIQNKITSGKVFFVQRFSRLYPLHLGTLLIVALLQAIYVSREGVSFVYPYNDAYHFILHLGFASYWGFQNGFSFNAPVWSVSIEVLLYFVFFLVALFRQGDGLFCLFISVLSFFMMFFTNSAIFRGLTMFFLGGYVFQLTYFISTKRQTLKRSIYIATAVFWVSVIINYYLIDLGAVVSGYGIIGDILLAGFPLFFLFPFTVCSLVLLEIDYGSFAKKLSWVGDITYSSYLLHFPLQILIVLAVSYGIISSEFYLSPLYLGLFFLVLIPLSYLVYRKFERPLQLYIRRRMLPS
ncbi:MAG: acyltransferase [Candidatus Promineifilaceae bacterium]